MSVSAPAELMSYATGFAPRDGPPLYPKMYQGLVLSYRPYLGATGQMGPSWSNYGSALNGTFVNWINSGRTSRFGWVTHFQDLLASNYVDCGLIPQLPATGSPRISVVALMRVVVVAQFSGCLIDNSQGGAANAVRLFMGRNQSVLKVFAGDGVGTTEYLSAANALALNAWRSVAITIDGTNNIRFYSQARPWGTAVLARVIAASNATWKIGLGYNTATVGADHEIAYLDVFNRTLSAEEIALYHRDPHCMSRLAT